MLPSIAPHETKSWQKLQKHWSEIKNIHLNTFFEQDMDRFSSFSVETSSLLLDYSKNHLNSDTVKLLVELANECKLSDAIEAMFTGEHINQTEDRAVLHTLLRRQSTAPFMIDGSDAQKDVKIVLDKVKTFCDKVHNGVWKGFTSKPIKNVVNIGIGGSDLGPYMVCEALKHYKINGINVHFVSNVDKTHINETLKELSPEETLFIIASKTFTTQETLANANSAKEWFLQSAQPQDVKKHFVALSTNIVAVEAFGIDPANSFEFWDWVGGRYSVWSSIGLSVALAIGFDRFIEFHKGAAATDKHFRETSFEKNIPVLMALIGIWYNNFWGYHTHAILPYEQYLHRFPAYLQQADMESNGKHTDRNQKRTPYQTGPIIWGEPGTNGQHAFYQLIHQGTKVIPCDFIASAESLHNNDTHHPILLSNFLAQSRALMLGKQDLDNPYRQFDGNRPSNSLIYPKLTPYTLGGLVATYEHKIFVQGIVWNIYSFDQWGVELGKQLAKEILPTLSPLSSDRPQFDSSTEGLISYLNKNKTSLL